MNGNFIVSIGYSGPLIGLAKSAASVAETSGRSEIHILERLREIHDSPSAFVSDSIFGTLAAARLAAMNDEIQEIEVEKPFNIFGRDILDASSIEQMQASMRLPVSIRGALCPDSHLGYGLPIGGVLATDNAVIPFAVGVDISCRMEMTITDIEPRKFEQRQERFVSALVNGTVFGKGKVWDPKMFHPVMDQDWNVTKITKRFKDTAASQLGTSGSGNHFCEWGIVRFSKLVDGLTVVPDQDYVALMTHSGSRGPGANVCKEYSAIAASKLAKKHAKYAHLAWLGLDTEAGQEYWTAMTLMRDFARANHECIHKEVCGLVGAQALGVIKNEHNLAWKEVHDGREMIVHRKGATPAGKGVLGVIPGSMGDPAYVVVGKGDPSSLNSASHGAGRKYSRTKARDSFDWAHWRTELKRRGVNLISGGLDEVPGAYKNIDEVMARQTDLVEAIARFDPRIVKMSDDGTDEG
jgi:tRNA-splicing ligase RtcB